MSCTGPTHDSRHTQPVASYVTSGSDPPAVFTGEVSKATQALLAAEELARRIAADEAFGRELRREAEYVIDLVDEARWQN
jgi:hypothetical protein